ncbi:MAG: VOC family protein [Pseudomonadota bacterium]
MSLHPYLFFDGACAEAFDFYKSVFGGEFVARMTFADAPPDAPFPEDEHHLIMHMGLPVGGGVLMGSDVSRQNGPAPVKGGNFAISFQAESLDQCEKAFAKLSNGGEIVMPMGDMFWGARFGMCTDKFGIKWMVNFDRPQQN